MELDRLILQTIEEFMNHLGSPVNNIELTKESDLTYVANLETDDSNVLIGYHGETLDAMQFIIKNIIRKKAGDEARFDLILDIENYRKRKEENWLKAAEQKAEIVRKTKRKQALPPMPAYLRRLVHVHLAQPQFSDLETISDGEGRMRHITIRMRTGAPIETSGAPSMVEFN